MNAIYHYRLNLTYIVEENIKRNLFPSLNFFEEVEIEYFDLQAKIFAILSEYKISNF